jgi:formate hydrogenlyase subunit 3/multisubunit Na+/H+ antiporter MnhD subunit
MRKIDTLNQLDALIGQTYMYAIIAAVIALALAFLFASLVKWEGGKNSRCHIKRRVWYIILGIVSIISFCLYNAFYVSVYIYKASLQAKFLTANLLSTLVLLCIYVVVGLLTMMLIRSSKWGSILGKSKK